MKYLLTASLWILWCALHSALIARPLTEYMKRKWCDQYRFYRLFYNIVALGTLIPLVYYSLSVRETPIFRWEGPLVAVKYLLLVTSVFLFVAGGRHYSMSQFLGIHQIKTGRSSHALSEQDTIDPSGILSVIRHPWYTAGIMIVWTRDITVSILLNNIVISVYFLIGAILEERKLLQEFGERYRQYQKDVSMFIPYRWLKTKIAAVL